MRQGRCAEDDRYRLIRIRPQPEQRPESGVWQSVFGLFNVFDLTFHGVAFGVDQDLGQFVAVVPAGLEWIEDWIAGGVQPIGSRD